jgi:hypothetical protein
MAMMIPTSWPTPALTTLMEILGDHLREDGPPSPAGSRAHHHRDTGAIVAVMAED